MSLLQHRFAMCLLVLRSYVFLSVWEPEGHHGMFSPAAEGGRRNLSAAMGIILIVDRKVVARGRSVVARRRAEGERCGGRGWGWPSTPHSPPPCSVQQV